MEKKTKISRLFGYLNSLPWTKPLAILTWAAIMLVFVLSWALGRDVPPNAMELGIYFGGVVFAAAAGKSGYEAVKRPRGPRDER
ncbi:hypothetical protein [Cloacibacillus sp. An23]|uniref:hypothetical protein n=1 Tax=Cloacibacillus sp. An23 TaxID=1965591 RepID=UPI000B380242|nr:hypothetical protein [Cloacibacillus sp. An23]OUO94748.1 hypothetical protein B5F39_02445 [Cloacibacillus sp. An23]